MELLLGSQDLRMKYEVFVDGIWQDGISLELFECFLITLDRLSDMDILILVGKFNIRLKEVS